MNDAPDLSGLAAAIKPIVPQSSVGSGPRKPCCANCSAMVKEGNDLTCHDSPPQVTVLALPAPAPRVGQMMIQNFCSFPSVRAEAWCRRHAFGSASGDARRAAAPAMLNAEGGE